MYTIAINALPIASGARLPAAPDNAITERKIKVPTSSVINLAARGTVHIVRARSG
jgi:hypothetical protein